LAGFVPGSKPITNRFAHLPNHWKSNRLTPNSLRSPESLVMRPDEARMLQHWPAAICNKSLLPAPYPRYSGFGASHSSDESVCSSLGMAFRLLVSA
jgi:hypothetical protein